MKKGSWRAVVVTRRVVSWGLFAVLLVGGLLSYPAVHRRVQRRLYGVQAGVQLQGHLVAGLLECELYDSIAGIGEDYVIEARNARFDWQEHRVIPEQVGQIVDVSSTVQQALQAQPGTELGLVFIDVVPTVTQAHFTPYYRGLTEEPKMSLMVNVDWGDEHIPSMLDTFAQHDVTTTWFPTGRWAARSPAVIQQIVDAGHELGNHGGWHGLASQMGADEVRRLILEGEERIEKATGQKPLLFAPPAGDMNSQTVAIAGEMGYKTVLWTIDTIDWQRPAPTVIIDRVVGKAQNGALVLMHPTQPTAEALPLIIEELKRRGYSLVTVSELLGGL